MFTLGRDNNSCKQKQKTRLTYIECFHLGTESEIERLEVCLCKHVIKRLLVLATNKHFIKTEKLQQLRLSYAQHQLINCQPTAVQTFRPMR